MLVKKRLRNSGRQRFRSRRPCVLWSRQKTNPGKSVLGDRLVTAHASWYSSYFCDHEICLKWHVMGEEPNKGFTDYYSLEPKHSAWRTSIKCVGRGFWKVDRRVTVRHMRYRPLAREGPDDTAEFKTGYTLMIASECSIEWPYMVTIYAAELPPSNEMCVKIDGRRVHNVSFTITVDNLNASCSFRKWYILNVRLLQVNSNSLLNIPTMGRLFSDL